MTAGPLELAQSQVVPFHVQPPLTQEFFLASGETSPEVYIGVEHLQPEPDQTHPLYLTHWAAGSTGPKG